MGDGITGNISKGPIHSRLDAYLNATNAGSYYNRDGFRRKLEAITPPDDAGEYLEILKTDVGVPVVHTDYLRDTWYNTAGGPHGGWWHHLQPIFPILNAGLIKTLEIAGNDRLIDSYWMPVKPATAHEIQVIILKSAAQVTRLIVTPAHPMHVVPRTHPVEMWTMEEQKHSNEVHGFNNGVDAVVVGLASAAVTSPPPPRILKIVTWQRLELP